MKREQLSDKEIIAVMRLLGDVRACRDATAAAKLLVDGACQLVDADLGWFVEIEKKDAAWKPVNFGAGSVVDSRLLRFMDEWGKTYPVTSDIMATSIITNTAPHFVQSWTATRDSTQDDRRIPFMDLMHTMRIHDMTDPCFSLTPDHRFAMNLQRIGQRTQFNERETAILNLLSSEMHWLHTSGRMRLSVMSQPEPSLGLSPRLQQVLERLVAGEAPKVIARQLGISVYTCRDHIKRLYRVFEVRGRDELMAKLIAGGSKPFP